MDKKQIIPTLALVAAAASIANQPEFYSQPSNYRGSSIPNTRERRKKYRNNRDRRNSLAKVSKKRNR